MRRGSSLLSLSPKRKHQINKPELGWGGGLFCSKCHLAVAESPEDQTGSPQASAGWGQQCTLFPFLVFAAACLSLSISSHHMDARARPFPSRLKCQSIPTLIVWADEKMCILINRVCELPTHPGFQKYIAVTTADWSLFPWRYAARRSLEMMPRSNQRRSEALASEIWQPSSLQLWV